MSLDVLTIAGLNLELGSILTGAKIDRIFQPERDIVLFSLRTASGNRKLLVSVNPSSSRVHFTDREFENPVHPPMFCMLLRKHLCGARITGVSQPNFDRMLCIHLCSNNELGDSTDYSLYVELMGKNSNLVLVDKDGRIIDCLRRMDFAGDGCRSLNPGLFYKFPPDQGKMSFFSASVSDMEVLADSCVDGSDYSEFLKLCFSGLSPSMNKEICFLADKSNLKKAMLDFYNRSNENLFSPVVYFIGNKTVEISAVPLNCLEQNCEKREYPNFSELLDSVFKQKDEEEHRRRLSKDLYSKIKTRRDRLKKKISGQLLEIYSETDLEALRIKAELVTSNIYRIKRGDKVLSCENYYLDCSPVIEIGLDPLKTPQQNSAALFKEYRKKKTAADILGKLVDSGKKELEYLNSVLDELSRCNGTSQLEEIKTELVKSGVLKENKNKNKKQKLSGPDKYVSTGGLQIFAGKNNLQNDELTNKFARRNDYWFHVKNAHGSHVVLSCNDTVPSERDLTEAASLAAFLSECSNSGKIAVDYTQIKNIKKPSGAFPGYVTYTDYKTVLVQSDNPNLNKI